jgi:VWFA-related protein
VRDARAINADFRRRFIRKQICAICLICGCAPALAAQNTASTEVTTQESQPAFELHVQHNEVMLRVVVRDSKGQAVTNLHQGDFRIFDHGKLQMITHFSVESAGGHPSGPSTAEAITAQGEKSATAADAIVLPTRYLGMFFDDVHLAFGDLARTRDAADKYLAANLKSGDRVGIFTSSGQNQLAFTDDRGKLHEALMKITPRPLAGGAAHECPTISPYQAYLIDQQQDPTALSVAESDALSECCGGNTPCPEQDATYVENLSQSMFQSSERESLYIFQGLEHLCRVMSMMVGQRSIVMVSPGFLAVTQIFQLEEVIDEALRQSVVIGTLDARGLYADVGLGDASTQVTGNPANFTFKSQWETLDRSIAGDVLGSIASETGGTYFHNNNDFVEGFRRAGGLPEAYYVLVFAPQDLKIDGRFHPLKVTLADNSGHFNLQTRKGYFAPSKVEDAATVAQEEMEQMVFSQEELQPIPLQMRTQFFKATTGDTRLTVLVHMDISHLRFRKAEGRNLENLTLVTAVFDRSGGLVNAEQKRIDLRLLDSTLERLLQSGMAIKSEVSVKPGTYLVREVVRDTEGGQMSALNSQVDVP